MELVRDHTKSIKEYAGQYVPAGGAGKMCPCMPCFSVHDFSYNLYGKLIHRFHCLQNYTQGCPDPMPRPKHIFKLTKRFQKRKIGDVFECIRCRQKIKIGNNDCDWIAIEIKSVKKVECLNKTNIEKEIQEGMTKKTQKNCENVK